MEPRQMQKGTFPLRCKVQLPSGDLIRPPESLQMGTVATGYLSRELSCFELTHFFTHTCICTLTHTASMPHTLVSVHPLGESSDV